jgi:predicted ATP-grasp superfamily ATP-dependent carboligase
MDRTVLIAAASGRALAASARRGGFAPLVVDFFADQDMIAAAQDYRRLSAGLVNGMGADELLAALDVLSETAQPVGIVCGTGFEDRADMLATIARRWTLLGNGPDVVAQVKDPVRLAGLCHDCGLPHPEISLGEPADSSAWLVKRRGGAGGTHVKAAGGEEKPGARAPGTYFQRRVAGTPVSASVLAHGHRATVLGFSTQWSAPAPHKPFRYGGALTPAAISSVTAVALEDAVRRIVQVVPLVGLNSVDFLVDGDEFCLLDINPRPSATLDIFEPAQGSLFRLHVEACGGALAELAPREGAIASAIVYAEHDIASIPALDWPTWTADRPCAGTFVKADEPLCTVMAVAATADVARRLVMQRADAILSRLSQRAA